MGSAEQNRPPAMSPTMAAGVRVGWLTASFLLGSLFVWLMLVPGDAVSVFIGQSQPQILLWLLLGVLVAFLASQARQTLFRFRVWHWVVAVLGLGWLVVVAVAAGEDSNPRVAWYGFWQVIALACSYLCARAFAIDRSTRAAMVMILVGGSIGLSVHAVYQLAVFLPSERAAYEADPDSVIAAQQLDAPPGSPAREAFRNRLYSPEPFATFALANSLAVFLTASLVILVATASGRWIDSQSQIEWKSLLVVIGFIGFIGIIWLLTRSRTAYVGMLAGLGLLVVGRLVFGKPDDRVTDAASSAKRSRRGLLAIAGVIVMLFVGLFALSSIDQAVIAEAPKSLAFRLEYWSATTALLVDHGLLGVGLGNFQAFYPGYMFETASETIADPHNFVLDVAATLSVPFCCLTMVWLALHFRSSAFSVAAERQVSLQEVSGVDSQRCARAMLAGALVGGAVLILFLALVGRCEFWPCFLSWLSGSVAVGLSRDSLKRVSENSLVMLAAAVSMLVCLMASGSWQAMGIAIPLMWLLALSQGAVGVGKTFGKFFQRYSGVLLALIGLWIFVYQSWQPTNMSWIRLVESREAVSISEAKKLVREAASADVLDAQPLEQLARLQFEDALRSGPGGFDKASRDTLEAFRKWGDAEKSKFTTSRDRALVALSLAAQAKQLRLDDSSLLLVAAESINQAIIRHPTSVQLRLQAAAIEQLAGRPEDAIGNLEEAVRLDAATPHSDRKIAAQQVVIPSVFWGEIQIPAELEGVDPIAGRLPAEPVLQWLRNSGGLKGSPNG